MHDAPTATQDRFQLLFHQLCLNRKLTANVITIMALISIVQLDVFGLRQTWLRVNLLIKIGVVLGDSQLRTSVMSGLTLPEFNDCKRQHIVDFLEELDS